MTTNTSMLKFASMFHVERFVETSKPKKCSTWNIKQFADAFDVEDFCANLQCVPRGALCKSKPIRP